MSFMITEQDKTFCVSAVYAFTNYNQRRNLWRNLQTQHQLPWCFIGDYNVIIEAHEYQGAFQPARLPMNEFLQWSSNNHLIHLPTRGAFFTWSNGRRGSNHTKKRLDRTICNHLWIDMCTSISCSTLIKNRSDHFPILLDFQTNNVSFASQFRFMQMWSLHPDCKKIVESCWNKPVVGCPMFVLSKKLKNLKLVLKDWNKEIFENVQDSVKKAEEELNQFQMHINQVGYTHTLANTEKTAQAKLDSSLQIEEVFWKEKSRVKWHAEGERNTKFFHRIANIKNSTNLISILKHDNLVITYQN